jgi:hypothetical protein
VCKAKKKEETLVGEDDITKLLRHVYLGIANGRCFNNLQVLVLVQHIRVSTIEVFTRDF